MQQGLATQPPEQVFDIARGEDVVKRVLSPQATRGRAREKVEVVIAEDDAG